jgi:hypothetical protein
MRLPRHRGNLAIRNKNLRKQKIRGQVKKIQRQYMMEKQKKYMIAMLRRTCK